jgi:metal-dependent HD superfamily phosphatase/phosphodiesterase/ribonuclease HI
MPRPKVTIYTDGACKPNPGPGGWAAVLRYPGREKVLTGGEPDTTSNRMELQAAISALEALREPSQVALHTDSRYMQQGITEWLPNWVARGWRKSDGKPVLNLDLWQRLYALIQQHDVRWHWVRGHSGDRQNERVDRLARQAIQRAGSPPSPTGESAGERTRVRSTPMAEEAEQTKENITEAPPTIKELLNTPFELHLPMRHNPKLQQVMARINAHGELQALWRICNVTAVDRLHMSDHGPVHVQIIANIALKVLRLLVESGVQPNVVREYGLQNEDAEIVVVLASLLHDIGMCIHRDDHERYSLFLAEPLIKELLTGLYEIPARTVLVSETLHAIIAHRSGGNPLTLEAGIVRVADALDMAKGRSRIPFEAGAVNIHSVSAAAIESLEIDHGEEKPVRLRVRMTNSAGIFQLDQLLKEKLQGSGLEPYIEVEAYIEGEEKKLVHGYRF